LKKPKKTAGSFANIFTAMEMVKIMKISLWPLSGTYSRVSAV
jgi:hypothetical protein